MGSGWNPNASDRDGKNIALSLLKKSEFFQIIKRMVSPAFITSKKNHSHPDVQMVYSNCGAAGMMEPHRQSP